MTPAEHLAEAERLLAEAGTLAVAEYGQAAQVLAGRSVAHALIAAAAELGVPHGKTMAGGGGEEAQAQAG